MRHLAEVVASLHEALVGLGTALDSTRFVSAGTQWDEVTGKDFGASVPAWRQFVRGEHRGSGQHRGCGERRAPGERCGSGERRSERRGLR